MATKKKRTRRAVKRRRTPKQHEAACEKLLMQWEAKLDQAIGKVQHYRKELKQARAAIARQTADEVFGEER